jgi:alpha-beta hydrolase superfamily lysophospholipase
MEPFEFVTSDGVRLGGYRWRPPGTPRGAVQIAHGMGEHAARYDRVGRALAGRGYLVVADDHRGHGRTAASGGFGDIGTDGWNRMIADLAEINAWLTEEAPGAPRVLLGHSMGAMLSQQYAYRHGDTLDALVLSGSPGLGAALQLFVSHTVARFERWRRGATAESPLLQRMLFGSANEGFEGSTGFEWLSRDVEEVAKYAADPQCGFVLRAGGLCDLFAGAREARSPRRHEAIPKALPILVFAGADDPVHGGGKGIDRLLAAYRRAGLENVESRLYPGGRHEMFNETNREEVTADLLAWLERALSGGLPRTAAPRSSPSAR